MSVRPDRTIVIAWHNESGSHAVVWDTVPAEAECNARHKAEATARRIRHDDFIGVYAFDASHPSPLSRARVLVRLAARAQEIGRD